MATGSVDVTVVPDAREFPSRLRAALARQRLVAEVELEADMEGFGQRLQARIDALRLTAEVNLRVDIDTTAARAQLAALGAGIVTDVRVDLETTGLRERVLTALANLRASVRVDVDLDLTAARAELAGFGAGASAGVRIDLDGGAAVNAGLASIALALQRLTSAPHVVNVRLDTGAALANLAALQLALNRLDDHIRRFPPLPTPAPGSGPGPQADRAARSMSKLLVVAASLAPALIPLAGAAGVAGAALVAAGGVGLLAFKGIKDEIALGTEAGTRFQFAIDSLRPGLAELKQTAAYGVLQPFEESVARLRKSMPEVNDAVRELSPLLGDAAGHVTVGLLSGLRTFAPVLGDIFKGVDRAAARFESWATGPGGAVFADALSDSLSRAVPVLGDAGSALVKIGAALAPIGNVELEGLGAAFDLIGKLADQVNRLVNTPGGKDFLASISKGLQEIHDGAVPVIAELGNLADTLSPLLSLGGRVADVLGSSLGGELKLAGAGVGVLDAGFNLLVGNLPAAGDSLRHVGEDLGFVEKQTNTAAAALKGVASALDSIKAAKAAAEVARLTAEAEKIAPVFGVTAEAYLAAKSAADKHTASAAAATLQMRLEGDAAGILKQAFDELNGKVLGVNEAETQLASSTLAAIEQLKTNAATVALNTTTGVTNREMLEGLVHKVEEYGIAVGKSTGSTEKGAAAARDHGQALLKLIEKTDGAKSTTYLYIKGLLELNDTHAFPTVAVKDKGVDAALDRFRDKLTQLSNGVTIPISWTTPNDTPTFVPNPLIPDGTTGHNDNQGPGHALGGLIGGVGTGTSDSNWRRVSKGEYVMPADVTAKNLNLLNAMRANKPYQAAIPAAGSRQPSGQAPNFTIHQVRDTDQVVNELMRRLAFAGSA